MAWDPAQYLKFEAERARPFHDLVGRIGVESIEGEGGFLLDIDGGSSFGDLKYRRH